MPLTRRSYKISGIVQGVGFRPLVYRLAHELDLSGWVRNSPAGVEIEIQGKKKTLEAFEHALSCDGPPLAVISSITTDDIPAIEDDSFRILPSSDGESAIQITPDSAICADCLLELFDPTDRRYRYPFITCTNCGPRYSIITGIPYDRPKTTMSAFPLCLDCLREYENPLDRRFHAQPIACHKCGPQVKLITSPSPFPTYPRWVEEHNSLPQRGRVGEGGGDAAVVQAIQLLKDGAILAIKAIGGYHLAVDACNHEAVQKLRERKKRDEKPFAVMAATLETARKLAFMDEMEERLLRSPEAAIVIVKRRQDTPLSSLIAPNNGWLGLMLPYAPLHHLLFHSSLFTLHPSLLALVMTSGNISDEPVVFEDDDALKRLAGIADYFLIHNRPIHIRSDDSVMRVFQGRPLFYRRARGYVPRAVKLPFSVQPILTTGAELKSAVCLATGDHAFLSQHIGDLQNESTYDFFRHTVTHLSEILRIRPSQIACDLHPDYLSSRFAEESRLPLIKVQHHHAHLASCMAENGLDGEVIGVIFDGTGYGYDGTIWGGEFLVGGYDEYRRAAHFRAAPLPGGDAAVREPWRMAMSYLYQILGEAAITIDHPVAGYLQEKDRALFAKMIRNGINSPMTSSCGRLFDAVAALLNIRHKVSYDGQAANELEALAESACALYELKSPFRKGDLGGFASDVKSKFLSTSLSKGRDYSYSFNCDDGIPIQLDFAPMFTEILTDMKAAMPTATIAHRFHQTVATATTEMCMKISVSSGLDRVILSGGVFQNRLLSEMIYTALTKQGLQVFTHRLVPPNDGGIALGQAAIAGRRSI